MLLPFGHRYLHCCDINTICLLNRMENSRQNYDEHTNDSDKVDGSMIDETAEIDTWDELDISPELLRGIYAYGFEKPSPTQRKAISPMLSRRDIINQAQSGTGKTGCFAIASLSITDLSLKATQVLILSPTRELSIQTGNIIRQLGFSMKDLVVQVLVGGSSIDADVSQLKSNPPHIITGCPGRIYDMLNRRHIRGNAIKLIVVDEADEMLSDGFSQQLYDIFRHLNKDVQVAFFSATFNDQTFSIIEKITKNPIKIIVKAEQLTLKGIKQYYIALDNDEQKYETIKDLYGFLTLSQCIIYANSVNRVMRLYDAMLADGFPVCCIHSNMDKSSRDKVFMDFKQGATRVLISSNITARGIDVQQVSTVINFDIPKDIYTYLHRIGRSGRWGRKGMGINLITKRDVAKMKEIEEYYQTEIVELPADYNK